MLLFIVYGVFLVIVGVTATAQVVLASTHFSTAVLNHTVGTDAQLVRGFVNELLNPDDLRSGTVEPARATELTAALDAFVTRRGIVRLEVRTPAGRAIASNDPVAGFVGADSADWQTAMAGEVAVAVLGAADSDAGPGDLGTTSVLREYFPLLRDGSVVGVVAVWRDGAAIVSALADVRRDVVLVTITAALAAAGVLFFVFRSAQGRISRQTIALLESTRRDALTGLLNHGAIVEAMAAATERVRMGKVPMAVGLLDIDNFRNLNDTWGHAAGDEAIMAVSGRLEERLADGWLVGRYGPDEFLVIAEGLESDAIGPALEGVRSRLGEVDLRFGDSDRLPITISVAVTSYPAHGSSVTELLANTAVTLAEAKAGGGDAIVFAGLVTDQAPEARTFDVFQGLILAVDAKDRYTKRHSEDVARYAEFLARRIGVPSEDRRIIRMAGLLHDVGKIGIPDQVLRRPGRLSEAETSIVQQHVALGDAIVRDLPNLDQIRAGIRHHHERWDGKGYLHRLQGEEIPQIARILAVCDTFSAMTTSRPYRKALPLEEALKRLGDAAGAQLDERLVVAFVHGIETDPHPPLPGDDAPPMLWVPDAELPVRVA